MKIVLTICQGAIILHKIMAEFLCNLLEFLANARRYRGWLKDQRLNERSMIKRKIIDNQ